MTIVVASTLAAYKCVDGQDDAWLTHAEAWQARGDVEWFVALQVGHGHDHKFEPLRRRLAELDATVWTFSVDDGFDQVTSAQRLQGICMGRNMAHEFVNRDRRRSHLLFLDSDTEVPADAIDRLLEVDHPVVGGHVPTYCLDGPAVQDCGGMDVREHMNTAGFLMLTREAVRRIRWGWSEDDGLTDDPWTQDLAERVGLGKTWVRHDVVARHQPESISPIERRGGDLSIVRDGEPIATGTGLPGKKEPTHCSYVLVPFKDKPELTCALIEQLSVNGGFDSLLLFDNGSTEESALAVTNALRRLLPGMGQYHSIARPGASLTEMWNEGWELALMLAPKHATVDLAILNNDLRIPEGFLQRMSHELRKGALAEPLWMVGPDWRIGRPHNVPGEVELVEGTFRHGGIHGAAYMVKAEARRHGLPPIDEQFAWWANDDDLVFSILAAGYKVGRIRGLGFEHVGGGSQTFDEAHEIKKQAHDDLRRCIEKWGR